ncbi:MAG TPA: RnfABCDGE type electron transport complex subunit D [Vitreimonas sp.]|nr:RnfABCDGE type electron transport complex subunit D [Vitreimonas sp.]
MKNWFSPIRILLIYLVVMYVWASWGWDGTQLSFWLTQFRNAALLAAGNWATYFLLTFLNLGRPTRWEHKSISNFILLLLFDPLIAWWVFPLLGIFTELVQRLVRVPTGPIFNPAALTAAVFSFVSIYPSWWGTNFAPRLPLIPEGMSVAMLLTLPLAGYVAHKYRKLPIVLISASVFAVLYTLLFRMSPLFLLADGTLAYFLMVMAVEPKTSPALPKQQYVFAGSLGVLVAIALYFYWPEPYAMALLMCNLAFNLYRNQAYLKTKLGLNKPPAAPLPSSV